MNIWTGEKETIIQNVLFPLKTIEVLGRRPPPMKDFRGGGPRIIVFLFLKWKFIYLQGAERTIILAAIAVWQGATCINFTESDVEPLLFFNGTSGL